MMKTAAIIAEYNPFHNGHQYQIEETRRLTGADYILVIMSGNFVQRGAPAICNKYLRTKMALLGGADAVIELPALYATSSAEFFAGGSVTVLNHLGTVDYLSFGSECGELEPLMACAKLLVSGPSAYNDLLSSFLKQGLSFPVARNKAVLEIFKSADLRKGQETAVRFSEETINNLFSSPNNILALEYCKALLATKSSITPITVKRLGDAYHEAVLNEDASVFGSSSAIRNAIENQSINETILKANLPLNVYELLQTECISPSGFPFLTVNDISSLLHYRLLTERTQGFSKYLDCSPALSDKICKYLPLYTDFSGFCALLKSKDLTYTRISRVLIHILLGITAPSSFKKTLPGRKLPVYYARLLGFKKQSTELLSSIKKNSSIPLISKMSDAPFLLENVSSGRALRMLKQDVFVSDIYETAFHAKYKKGLLNEYQQSPIIIP